MDIQDHYFKQPAGFIKFYRSLLPLNRKTKYLIIYGVVALGFSIDVSIVMHYMGFDFQTDGRRSVIMNIATSQPAGMDASIVAVNSTDPNTMSNNATLYDFTTNNTYLTNSMNPIKAGDFLEDARLVATAIKSERRGDDESEDGMSSRHAGTIVRDEEITLALNFTLSSDVIKITHVPEKQEIRVHLIQPSTKRRCKRPKLKARLSGPYLSIIKWTHDSIFSDDDDSTDDDVLVGHYLVPEGGTYFIEIIAIFCERPSYRRNMTGCYEDTRNHRMTSDNATIHVLPPKPETLKSPDFPQAFWKWKRDLLLPQANTRRRKDYYYPISTRVQHIGCQNDADFTRLFSWIGKKWIPPPKDQQLNCANATSLRRFEDYELVWNDPSISDVVRMPNNQLSGNLRQYEKGNKETVCFIGMNHSRGMVAQMDTLQLTKQIKVEQQHIMIMLQDRTKQINEIKAKKRKSGHPYGDLQGANITETFLKMRSKHNCKRALVAIEQWSASTWSQDEHFSFLQYEKEMFELIQSLRDAGVEPLLRSLSPVPISALRAVCPPIEWNSHAVDGYNEILSKISRQEGIPFINADFILDPVWDSLEDYMHPTGPEADRTNNHIMRELIRLQI